MTTDLIHGFQAHLRERARRPRTIETYTRTLTIMHQQLPYGLETANETEIKAWIWRDGLKPATRAVYLAAVREFFRWCVDHAEVLTFDPTRRLHPPKIPRRVPRVATDEQVEKVMTGSFEPYLLWATLAAYSGLRCIEIWRLRREHIDERQLIVVEGKGGVQRTVATHPIVWDAVAMLPPGPIVTDAQVVDERVLSRDFRGHARLRLGMPGVGLHKLRGWWATNTYRVTKDIRAVQHGMGHANPGTTAGYIAADDTAMQAGVLGLPVFKRRRT